MQKMKTKATGWAAAALIVAAAPLSAQAALQWNWQYSGVGVDASGTLLTGDVADAEGFYLVSAISGVRNGEAITGLQATGTAIPLNEPFAVDNLVKADGTLSSHGIGYATTAGTYANLFLAGWLSPAQNVEFSSIPALSTTAEVPVSFSFALAGTVPEPSTLVLAALGLAMLSMHGLRGRLAARAGESRRS